MHATYLCFTRNSEALAAFWSLVAPQSAVSSPCLNTDKCDEMCKSFGSVMFPTFVNLKIMFGSLPYSATIWGWFPRRQ